MFVKIFDNYHAGVSLLPEAEQDAFYGAVMRYAFDGTEPSFDGGSAVLWATIRGFIDDSLSGQENGSKGGNGRGNKNPRKDPAKTDTEKTPEKGGCKTPSENQKKRKEGNGNKNPEGFVSNSHTDGVAAVTDATPPSARCPMCDTELERTGMPDPDFWWCPYCKDGFPEGKAVR